jgi:3-carboxy-cis,cis-muconate cycloisomerase
LPQLFGLASGALHEARGLAEGLEVHTDRMRANIDATQGLLFADAVAARLAPSLGRAVAHTLVEHAAEQVRSTGTPLREVLTKDPAFAKSGGDGVLDAAFDLTPSIAAAAAWTDRALATVDLIRERLSSDR